MAEAYGFNWVGKAESRAEAFRNVRADFTLRPSLEDSVNFNTTQNLYIEGDNLTVMKILQESYLDSIKMIYIDPPYNTGNDFIYRDNFTMDADEFDADVEFFDADGNKNFRRNSDSNPRFHSDWCSMIYSRLICAKSLLTRDGVIFISIDDHEVANLRKICDEVFGERNFVGQMTLLSNPRGSQNSKNLSYVHEYLLMYARDIQNINIGGVEKSQESLKEFTGEDSDGRKYRLLGLRKRGGAWRKEDRPNLHYPIYVNPLTGKCSLTADSEYSVEVIPKRPTGELSRWTWSKDKFQAETANVIGKRINRPHEDDAWDIFRIDYLDSANGAEKTTKLKTVWIEKETNYQNAKNEIRELFGNSEMFDFPKPTYIIKRLMSIVDFNVDDIVLDFFSGSATTAHAVMQLNAEDGGNRKFIMIQLPEECNEKSEAYKAGYKNICEIGKERIRRAGQKIKSESPLTTAQLDVGFRVFKLDTTNYRAVYHTSSEWLQLQKDNRLDEFAENIKSDRTALDLLFGCLLERGKSMQSEYSEEQVDGYTIQYCGDVVACFDKNIPRRLFEFIAKKKPLNVIFRDEAFVDSVYKLNVMTYFKHYAPDTKVNVI